MQCLCHISVDSQEDRRVGVTKTVGDREEETTGRRNHTECWKHPHPRQSPSVPEGRRGSWRGRRMLSYWAFCCCFLMVFRRCCRAGDGQGGSGSKRRDACWGLRTGALWGRVWYWRVRSLVLRLKMDLFFHPFLLFFLSLSPAEHSWQTKLWHSTLRRERK